MDYARIGEIIAEHGESMILRRAGQSDLALKGKRYDFRGEDVAGAVQQGIFRVKISNAEIAAAGWPGPPRKGDKLVIDGRALNIEDAPPRKDGETVLIYILTVKG